MIRLTLSPGVDPESPFVSVYWPGIRLVLSSDVDPESPLVSVYGVNVDSLLGVQRVSLVRSGTLAQWSVLHQLCGVSCISFVECLASAL